MAGMTVANNEHLIRSELWSNRLKEYFEETLHGKRYVDMLTDFPDGDLITIPSLGQSEINDYSEGESVKYTALDTGEFQFNITEYTQSGHYISNKMKQDSFYSARVISAFEPKMRRALEERMERDILKVGPDGQTASDLNAINGGNHRFIGGGTNEVIEVQDFARVNYAMNKANVPWAGRVAIVDPSVTYELSTLANLVNVSNNPKWEGIIRDGMSDSVKFFMNIYGIDVYESNMLKTSVNETIDGKTTTAGVANIFFSTQGDALPFIGAVRQSPKVDSEYNKDEQREEYVLTSRYGFGLYRPESLVTVITDTDQVA